jgi:uncharacterized Rossmann fold enzyme
MDRLVISEIQNPHASEGLKLSVQLECNISADRIAAHIRENSARPELPWLSLQEPHERKAVLVGGGPSAAYFVEDIRDLQSDGAAIFSMNGSSAWLRAVGVEPDYQIIIDGSPEVAHLFDPLTKHHLLASQVMPHLVDQTQNVTLLHLASEDCEDHLPADRRAMGGYSLIGGGFGVGNSAGPIAYVMGFRDLHFFGMDSSNKWGKIHAYKQACGETPDRIETIFMGKTYVSTFAMKAQAELFQEIARELKELGCSITVIGDGLLPDIYNYTRDLSER